ncbi:hypothetical protein, partial [Anaerotruncus rubiinfantis]|uniref:hypothetical protein n=1 Tax=Anaerotruncus rubiinfantis TaxID=1720200 RepID=UPI001A9B2447
FILSEFCKPCLFLCLFNFAQLILPYQLFGYLLRFLQESYNATTLEEARPVYIQKFFWKNWNQAESHRL